MGLLRRLRTDDELAELRGLAATDDQLGFADLPDEDHTIAGIEPDTEVALVLPDVVFEALDLSVLSGSQRTRVLERVLSGIAAAA